jgi:hypothetical protein
MNARVSKISKALLDISQCADVVLRMTNSGTIALRGKGISNAERCLLERIDGFRSLEQILAISGDVIGLHATMGKLLALGMVVPDGDAEPQAIAPAPAPAPVAAKAPTPIPAPQPKPAAAKSTPQASTAAPQQPKAAPLAPARPTAPAATAKPAAVAMAPKAVAPVQKAALQAKPAAVAPTKEQSELAQAKALLRVEAGYLFNGDKAKKVIARIDACKNTEEVFDLIVKLQGLLAKTGKVNPDVFLERLTSGLAKIRESQKSAPAAQATQRAA